jgi:bifunctional ADP-heptose synthase (sugar kinase/adenylyltransferase)
MSDVIIIGDYMLDIVLSSSSQRKITQAQGLPSFVVSACECLPGGAGTVSRLLISADVRVECVGIVGDDWAGTLVKKLLTINNKKKQHYLFKEAGTKTRVRAYLCDAKQPFVRIDQEGPTKKRTQELIRHNLRGKTFRAGILGICDFGKGGGSLYDCLIEASTIVVASTKSSNVEKYRNVDILIVNAKEQCIGPVNNLNERQIRNLIATIRSQGFLRDLIITDGKAGVFYSRTSQGLFHIKARPRRVRNTVGCGDTFFAALLLGLNQKETIMTSVLKGVYFSTLAAGHPSIALPALSWSSSSGYRQNLVIHTLAE